MVDMPHGSPNDARIVMSGRDSATMSPADRRLHLCRSIQSRDSSLVYVCRQYIDLGMEDQQRLCEALNGSPSERWQLLRRLPPHLRRFAMDAIVQGMASIAVGCIAAQVANDEMIQAMEEGN